MFKSWKSDKKKIKAVFKLQFQATQVPQLKKPALVISLVPEDVGKTTFKLEKAAVKDGICLWENPIYVTVKLVKHQKTGKLDEKIYHFIVSSGSSKSGYLGEASIDFAEFAEETQPLTISLPLKFANSGAVLNVTVQRLHEGTDQSYIEDNGESMSHDNSMHNRLSVGNANGNDSFSDDPEWDNLLSEVAEPDGSIKGSNGSILSSSRQNSIPQKVPVDNIATKNRMHRRSSTEWSMGSASDGSLIDSINSHDDSFPREQPGSSDESIEKLRSEMNNLLRQSELSELELQSLRKQITKETKRAQDLSRQVIELKEERDAIKSECIQLRSQQKFADVDATNRLRAENKDVKIQLEEIRRELSQEKELNSNLKMQLQKTQDSNSELILAVNDLDEMLEQKKLEISELSAKREISESVDHVQNKECKCKMTEEETVKQKNDVEEFLLMKQKITDLNEEIEHYREDREKLENYIEQLTQDYADLEQKNIDISSELEQQSLQNLKMRNECTEYVATIKDLESQVQRLEDKLQRQTRDLSESLDSIHELESEVKALEKELEKQAQQFENDLEAMTSARVEQEQRAIVAEESLRKTKLKNSITAERLQEELKRLSAEMAGKLDENEKRMAKAIAEANELRAQNEILEEKLQRANEETSLIRDQSGVEMEELYSELDSKTKQIQKMSSELEATSLQLRSAQKQVEEMQESFSLEVKMLKDKIDGLVEEKNELLEKSEHAKSRDVTVEDAKTLMERWNTERAELERKFSLAKKEAEKAQKELLVLRSSKAEKETLVQKLLSEAESQRSQHMELKNSLTKGDQEKEKLRKQVLELKRELQKRKEGSNITEKKLNGHATSAVGNSNAKGDKKLKTRGEAKATEDTSVASPKRDDAYLTEMLAEMAQLKERNKSMETELKDMAERYSEISLKFAEVEGERQQLVMTVRNLKNGKR